MCNQSSNPSDTHRQLLMISNKHSAYSTQAADFGPLALADAIVLSHATPRDADQLRSSTIVRQHDTRQFVNPLRRLTLPDASHSRLWLRSTGVLTTSVRIVALHHIMTIGNWRHPSTSKPIVKFDRCRFVALISFVTPHTD
jgi:hypothetical protein